MASDKPPQCNSPNVIIFAFEISWQGLNGLDVLPFTAEVYILRKHGSQWRSCALPAQLLNGFSNYAYLQEEKKQMSGSGKKLIYAF